MTIHDLSTTFNDDCTEATLTYNRTNRYIYPPSSPELKNTVSRPTYKVRNTCKYNYPLCETKACCLSFFSGIVVCLCLTLNLLNTQLPSTFTYSSPPHVLLSQCYFIKFTMNIDIWGKNITYPVLSC